MERSDDSIKVWVTSSEGRLFNTSSGTSTKTLVFNIKKKEIIKFMNFLEREHPIWTMVIVYKKQKKGTNPIELKRYYNFDNKKTFPQSINEI